ncbi:MAG: hypothetical protein ACREMP_10850 [Candidatus Tyrphobacter sp.]
MSDTKLHPVRAAADGVVHGWVSWSPRKGVVTLRNPSDAAQEFVRDVERELELPEGAPRTYRASDPYAPANALDLRAGRPHVVRLAPFEVRVLELVPSRA